MNRTGEVVLSIIGAVVYAIFGAFGAFMIWLQGNEDLIQQSLEEGVAQDPNLSMSDFEGDLGIMMDAIGTGGLVLTITAFASVALGILSMIFLKGNKKPKAAGIILIVTAVVAALVSFGAGIFPGIFYLIAGIMALVRKPKTVIDG
ncbi:DUF4064 domain-containing protein [Oceanobacillus halotolerans]|uniref:DUF4064 domain-containing protein n=1 Tax=Oceanobacillus halotolerans TaxID=2663380 RepID=UPI0013DD5C0D|nr:DUF4064 domain-containing protein [Oceanobacillus halotolerans]